MYVAPSSLTCPLDRLAITTKHRRDPLSLFFFVPDFKSETLSGVQSVLALYLKIGDILGMYHYVHLVGHRGF